MLKELTQTVSEILSSLGLSATLVKADKQDMHTIENNVGTFIGVITRGKDSKGIISLEFTEPCANLIIDGMMPGFGVTYEQEMGMSALVELTNMIAGNFISKVSNELDITPPTGIYGKDLKILLNTVNTAYLVFNVKGEMMFVKISNS